jgi:NAD(P)-dependent dehydrogenase (short-subunit alcohol dehydrogenase family)
MPEASKPESILTRLFGLQGQTAVVAGGAGRIGRAICHALVEAGATVCVLDNDRAAASSIAELLTGETGEPVIAHVADCTRPADLEQAAAAIAETLGPPNILVNCTQFRGSGFYSSSVEDYPLDAWQRVLDVNLTGVLLTCQIFGRLMASSGGGRIVNLASTYGVVSPDPRIYGESGVNSPVSYAASKAGVVQLTRYLAVHWRDKQIRVNCLVPGGVFDNQSDEFVAAYCQRTPSGRMAKAEDYQAAVLFLVSPGNDYMTGSILTVDGGWTAW